MAQSIEDMRKKIMLASNRKILRRQMELLASLPGHSITHRARYRNRRKRWSLFTRN